MVRRTLQGRLPKTTAFTFPALYRKSLVVKTCCTELWQFWKVSKILKTEG